MLAIDVGNKHAVDVPGCGRDCYEVTRLSAMTGVIDDESGLPTRVGGGVGREGISHRSGGVSDWGYIVEAATRAVLDVVFQVGAKPHQVKTSKVQPVPKRAANAPDRASAGLER